MRIFACIWVLIWLVFFVRGFILTDYKVFKKCLTKSVEEKRRCMMKEVLYDFIVFCQGRIPKDSDFTFVCDRQRLDPTEISRVTYYLYPRRPKDPAPYIIVFGVEGYKKAGFEMMEKFGSASFILRKVN
jgi:hypothetical protein